MLLKPHKHIIYIYKINTKIKACEKRNQEKSQRHLSGGCSYKRASTKNMPHHNLLTPLASRPCDVFVIYTLYWSVLLYTIFLKLIVKTFVRWALELSVTTEQLFVIVWGEFYFYRRELSAGELILFKVEKVSFWNKVPQRDSSSLFQLAIHRLR